MAQLIKAHMNDHERIIRNPKIVDGQPVFRGTRVPLKTVLAADKS